jgi:mono/diheme cytochrome c family protein
MRIWLTIVPLLFLFAGGGIATAQVSERHGRGVVMEFCARCHAVGKVGKSPHADAPPFRTLGRSFDLDQFPRLLERGISSGHPDMPEFKLSADDALAVSAYLRSIQQ